MYIYVCIYIYIYIYIYILWEKKRQINYKFIPKSLFGGCPLIRGFTHQWATT